jgi:excisionase family DNA binding protein
MGKPTEIGSAPAEFLTSEQLAELLRVDPKTVKRWRSNGDGPPFIRLGERRLIYSRADVDAWLAERRYAHRAAEAAAA